MLYMVIERFHNRDPRPIYQRVAEHGRQIPDGLRYVNSWVETNFDRCFQVMECDDPALLDQWVSMWSDLVDFEFIPVMTSPDARKDVLGDEA